MSQLVDLRSRYRPQNRIHPANSMASMDAEEFRDFNIPTGAINTFERVAKKYNIIVDENKISSIICSHLWATRISPDFELYNDVFSLNTILAGRQDGVISSLDELNTDLDNTVAVDLLSIWANFDLHDDKEVFFVEYPYVPVAKEVVDIKIKQLPNWQPTLYD